MNRLVLTNMNNFDSLDAVKIRIKQLALQELIYCFFHSKNNCVTEQFWHKFYELKREVVYSSLI